jgi:small subunit ribosomal protein S1
MNDKNEDTFFDENKAEDKKSELLHMIDAYDKKIRTDITVGSKVSGTVTRIGSEYAFVDIGGKNEALLGLGEVKDENGELTVKTGDKVTAFVVSDNAGETVISKSIGSQSAGIQDLIDAMNNRTPVQGKITGVAKAGLNVKIMGHRAFCPVSQIDIKFTEDVNQFLGKTLDFVVTKVSEGGRNIVVSRIPILESGLDEKLDEIAALAGEKTVVKGTISKIADFGLFVSIGSLEGLVHISEVSWERAEKLSDSFQAGMEVECVVLKVEKKQPLRNSKISLSIKQVLDNPWSTVHEKFKPGQPVQGKVTRITNFGAFVELSPGIEGLVHVSEMSWLKRVNHPSEVVNPGDLVNVTVLLVDDKKRTISLSLKDVTNDPWKDIGEKFRVGSEYDGIIARKSKFGYFVDLAEGITGLLVFSNIKSDIKDKLAEGQTIKVLVESVDAENRRISLSHGVKDARDHAAETTEYIKKQNQRTEKPASSSTEFGAALSAALKAKK